MAYPFIPFPTWGEFLQKLAEHHGVRIQSSGVKIPLGSTLKEMEFLERKDGQKTYKVPLQPYFLNQVVQPMVMQSIIRQLRLKPSDFGFSLDD